MLDTGLGRESHRKERTRNVVSGYPSSREQPGVKLRDREVALEWVVSVAGEPPHGLACRRLPRVSLSPTARPRGCEFGPRPHGNQWQSGGLAAGGEGEA